MSRKCGFRPNRGVMDLIFTMKMIMEKSWEWAQVLYMFFIDFEKISDTVLRVTLCEALRGPAYRVPPPLVSHKKYVPTLRECGQVSRYGKIV